MGVNDREREGGGASASASVGVGASAGVGVSAGADPGADAGTDAGAGAVPVRRLGRRRLLQGVGAVLLVGGSAVGIVRTRGYAVAPGRRLAGLSVWQFVVVEHAARRIAAPDRPGDASIPGVDELDVAGFVDGWMARMPALVRRDLGRFLGYLEHLAPLAVGLGSRFTRLGPGDQDAVLSGVEASSSDLLRAGFDGLKSLVFMGYYRDPRTWSIAGYDGPIVGRPAGGWR